MVFVGALDGTFTAYDDKIGEQAWLVGLDDVPTSNSINGKQYIAVISGGESINFTLLARFVPEIKNRSNRSATVWMFELHDE